MNIPLMQMIAAAIMVGATITFFYLFRRYLAAQSERRMLAMLESVGLDPAVAFSGSVGTILSEVRQRCQSCASEAVCERWLSGDADGDNEFCPNSRVFSILRKYRGGAR